MATIAVADTGNAVTNYTNLKNAVEVSAAVGDIVTMQRATYNQAGSAGITINKGIDLVGEGKGTVITPSGTTHTLIIDNSGATVDRLKLRNFDITGSGGATLDGISFAGSNNRKLTFFEFSNLNISGMRNGMFIAAFDTSFAGIWGRVMGCQCSVNRSFGYRFTNHSLLDVRNCEAGSNGLSGYNFTNCLNSALLRSSSEFNNTAADANSAQIGLNTSHGFLLDVIDIEGIGVAGGKHCGIQITNCLGGRLGPCNIASNSIAITDATGVEVVGGTKGWSMTDSMRLTFIKNPITVDALSEWPRIDPRKQIIVAASA